ncbi:MAG: hypothetical protein KDM63_07070 [Verrucomicrobiae bacterium]|nr:hypothetical protein [Verrucomicrobiae bacterium]
MKSSHTEETTSRERIVSATREAEILEMKSWEVIRETLKGCRRKLDQVASEMSAIKEGMRITVEDLNAWQRPPKIGTGELDRKAKLERTRTINPLLRIDGLMEKTGNVLPLEWLAAVCGGIFVRGERAYSGNSLPNEWYQTWGHLHSLRGEIKRAFDDDSQFSSEEIRLITFRWFRVQSWIEGLLRSWEKQPLVRFDLGWDLGAEWRNQADVCHVMARAIDPSGAKNAKVPREEIALVLGVSKEAVATWTRPPKHRQSGTSTPLDQLLALMKVCGSELPLAWMALRQGGWVVREGGRNLEKGLLKTWIQVHLELAELDCAISRAAVHLGEVEAGSVSSIRAEWEDVKRWVPGFIRQLSEGTGG